MSLAPLPSSMGVRDVRQLMVRKSWSIGQRAGAPTSLTYHWNGPEPVNRSSYATELRQLIGDSQWHTRPGAFDVASGGDGIMYHFAVTFGGIILQLRDIEDRLWHAGNAEANTWSISIHFPLGGDQIVSDIQWQRGCALAEALISCYHMAGRQVVRGHHEWPRSGGGAQSDCPGTDLLRRIAEYRGQGHTSPRSFEVRPDVDYAAVRQAPTLTGKEAARLAPGTRFSVSEIVADDSNRAGAHVWLHREDQLGFTHISTCTEVL